MFKRVKSSPRMKHCCHIWNGVALFPLSCLQWVQKRLNVFEVDELIFPPFSQRWNISWFSLFHRSLHGDFFRHSSVPPDLQTWDTHCQVSTSSHLHSLRKLSRQFYSKSFSCILEISLCGTEIRDDASPITPNLSTSSLPMSTLHTIIGFTSFSSVFGHTAISFSNRLPLELVLDEQY